MSITSIDKNALKIIPCKISYKRLVTNVDAVNFKQWKIVGCSSLHVETCYSLSIQSVLQLVLKLCDKFLVQFMLFIEYYAVDEEKLYYSCKLSCNLYEHG